MGIEKKKEETKQITKRLPTAIIYFGLSAKTKFKKKKRQKEKKFWALYSSLPQKPLAPAKEA